MLMSQMRYPLVAEVAGVTFSDPAPVVKLLNPGPEIFQIWESDSGCHRFKRNLPMFCLRNDRAEIETAEIEKWLRDRFF